MNKYLLLTLLLVLASFTPTTEAKNCNIDCKIATMNESGIDGEFAKSIAWTCKNEAKNPVHCIKMASAIITAESSGGYKCKAFNCFGMYDGRKSYKSKQESVSDWVTRYNKWWYKATGAEFFYGKNGKTPKSHYCMSEASSGTRGWCPNGYKHGSSMIEKLNKKF